LHNTYRHNPYHGDAPYRARFLRDDYPLGQWLLGLVGILYANGAGVGAWKRNGYFAANRKTSPIPCVDT
jgi:hypothetical protein